MILLSPAASSAGVNSWTHVGPDGGTVVDVVASSDGRLVLASGSRGLFRSQDGGDSWVGLAGGLGRESLSFGSLDRWRPGTLWLGTEAGVRRSDDYGVTWEPKNTGLLNPGVGRVVVDPHDPDRLWALTSTRVFTSFDQGETWNGTVEGPASTFELVADPLLPGRLWATANGNLTRVWRSDDGGVNWLERDTSLPSSFVTGLAIDPADSDRIWVGFAAGQLYRSDDAGASWLQVAQFPQAVIRIAATAGRLYLNTLEDVLESSDLGVSFSPTECPAVDIQKVVVSGGRLWAAALSGLYRRSVNGGSWELVKEGLSPQFVTAFAQSSETGRRYLTTLPTTERQPGIFVADDAGWSDVSTQFSVPFATAVAVGPGDTALIGVIDSVGSEIYRRIGSQWQSSSAGLGLGVINEIEIDPHDAAVSWTAMASGVFRSTDGGATWVDRSQGLPQECCQVGEIDLDPRPGGPAYAMVAREGVFKSTDQGASWQPARAGLFLDTLSLAVDPSAPDTLYAGTATGAVYRTDNAGASWQEVGALEEAVIEIAVDPRPGSGVIYASGYGVGVFSSRDRGATWQPISEGLESTVVTVLYPVIEDGVLTLYAGTAGGGLFARTIADGDPLGLALDFSWSPTLPRPGEVVVFRPSAPGAPADSSLTWDWGDGGTFDGSSPSHVFPGPGTYRVRLSLAVGSRATTTEHTVTVAAQTGTQPCVPSASTLCLHEGRFEVGVAWNDFSGGSGVGQLVTASRDSGLFWFFDAENWELLIKVLDGCALNQRFWVFSAATTTVDYTVTVRDTIAGESWEYHNPAGVASPAITDTEALPTCP